MRKYLIVQRTDPKTWAISHTEWVAEESGSAALKKYAKIVLKLDEPSYKIFLKNRMAHTVCYNTKNLAMIRRLRKALEKENWREELEAFLKQEKSKMSENDSKQLKFRFV